MAAGDGPEGTGGAPIPGSGGAGGGDEGGAGPGTGGSGSGGVTGSAGAGGNDPGGADASALPDVAREAAVPPDVDGQIVINEIMASNALTSKDETGKSPDWIELYNPTSHDIPLDGYALSDDFALPGKAPIAPGQVLRAGGFLVLWMDGVPGGGPAHLPIKLVSTGGAIGLSRPDGSFITRLAYGAQETDLSAAREPDGSDLWVIEWHVSPGMANPKGAGHAMLPAGPGAPPEAVPAAGDLTEIFLGYDAFPQLRIDVDAAGAAKLLASPLVHVPATLIYQGRSYGPVGLRLKGHNSFEPFDHKPSLKVSVDKYVPNAKFFGLNDLTLNNMHSDPSMTHERLAYWVARNGGVPASRAAHTMLSINGEPPALYIHIETVKRKMISRWFMKPDGALYEGLNVDFTRSDTDYMPPRDDVPFFSLQGKLDDRTLLGGLADALANPSPGPAIAGASNFMNMPEFQRFWAMCAVVGQFDSMPYSVPGDDFLVYGNPEDSKLQVLPWGMDETFEASDVDVIKRPYSVLARTCVASPPCLQQFADAAWTLLDKVETMKWGLERARIAQQIAPFTVMDHKKSYTDAQVSKGQEDMAFFINDRRLWLTKFLPARSKP